MDDAEIDAAARLTYETGVLKPAKRTGWRLPWRSPRSRSEKAWKPGKPKKTTAKMGKKNRITVERGHARRLRLLRW